MGKKRGPVDKVSLSTSAHQELEEAQDYVAATAIKYMEDYQGVVPQDYNYPKLKTLEQINASLARELKTVKRENTSLKQQMKETVNTNKLLSKGSDGSLGTEQSFATNLKLQVSTNMSAQSTPGPASLSVQKKRIYRYDDTFYSAYGEYSHEDSDEDYHQDMDDDYGNYVRSP